MKIKLTAAPVEAVSIPTEKREANLDTYQKAAVETTEKRVIVVAAAGSGKTRVITERLLYLLKHNCNPKKIVCITFTNFAAEEMKKRLDGVPGVEDIFVGTIHALAHKILGRKGEKILIYTPELEAEFVKFLTEKYCKFLTFERWAAYEKLDKDVKMGNAEKSELLNFLTPAEEVERALLYRSSESIPPGDEMPLSVFKLCELNNVITFDKLLVLANEYFRTSGTKPENVLVDEFQDVGELEYKFIRGLDGENNFYVGDDWQSIYGFKGADVNIFLNCVSSGFKVYYLLNNYRNTEKILEYSKKIMLFVEHKLDKNINRCVDGEGEIVTFPRGSLCQLLLTIKEQECAYNNWFFLARTNKDLYYLKKLTSSVGLPADILRREGLDLSGVQALLKTNTVKILTIHAAKGLEVENVLLYSRFKKDDFEDLKPEEARIYYVAVTRAKRGLVIVES